jgi:hypothetical protein
MRPQTIDTISPELLQEYNTDILRKRVRPLDVFDEIDEVGDILAREWEALTKNQIDALKLRVDILFRKLAKVLPDLKLMEHDVGDTAGKVTFIMNLSDKPHNPANEGKKL